MRRATYHLGVLALVGAVTLGGLGAQWNPDGLALDGGQSTAAAFAPRAGGPGAAPALASADGSSGLTDPRSASSALEQQVPLIGPSSPLQPRRASVRWVQNFRPTDLFAGAEPGASPLGQTPQFTTFQIVHSDDLGWLRLYNPGTGSGALPGFVWARASDFGPSGPPPIEYELTPGGTPDPVTGSRTPERVGSTWPRNPSADQAVILDGESGGMLYGKNAHRSTAPASLTKIMTAIVAIERGRPNDRVRVDVDSRTMWDSTVMGLTPGEVVSMEALLYGLMLPSGNDAAMAIARHLAGSEAGYVGLMNEKARALGLENTQFRNPHGLDEDGHFSSPYDLAMMARLAMPNQTFMNLAATRHWQGEGYSLWNLNKLIGQYPGADGVKVGFTDNAGRCIVASATRDGHRVFVSLIRSNDPVGESRMLLDYAFQNFRW